MRIGSINFLMPKIQTGAAVAERGPQNNPQASYSALFPSLPDVFIKQASRQPQTSSSQVLMQRPHGKEPSPPKQKSEPTPEKPITLTKGGDRQFK